MVPEIEVAVGSRRLALPDLDLPLDLAGLIAQSATGPRRWEMELGFGKGRYLLGRATGDPAIGFVGVEMAGRYQRLAAARARRRGLSNLVLLRGEAIYLLSAILPRGFASAVHVYFPDPWPKSKHTKRRFLGHAQVDLVLASMTPGGTLFFATDFVDYGELVAEVLTSHPRLKVTRRELWPEGPRTNYEAKYIAEGRPILRLEATLLPGAADRDLAASSLSQFSLLHPDAKTSTLIGPREREPS